MVVLEEEEAARHEAQRQERVAYGAHYLRVVDFAAEHARYHEYQKAANDPDRDDPRDHLIDTHTHTH